MVSVVRHRALDWLRRPDLEDHRTDYDAVLETQPDDAPDPRLLENSRGARALAECFAQLAAGTRCSRSRVRLHEKPQARGTARMMGASVWAMTATLLLAACTARTSLPDAAEGDAATVNVGDGITVTRRDEQVKYVGEMTDAGFAALERLTRGRKIQTLMVDSAGGEIVTSMDFGDWVANRKVDVVVERLCLSSCANYIFPAARTKLIQPGAVVAWHGSARQRDLLAELNQIIDERVDSLKLSAGEKERKRQEMRRATADYLRGAQLRQDAFFSRIGVDEYVTRIGNEEYHIGGLYYLSVEDMARFGITNVRAPPDYEQADLRPLTRQTHMPITYLKLQR